MNEQLDVVSLFPEVMEISDENLRDKVIAVWQRLWQESKFNDVTQVPVSAKLSYPHIPHNRSVVQMALRVAEVLERFHGTRVNRDHLLAAAILQDASKLVEYEPGQGGVVASEVGGAYQHAFYAAHVALEVGLPHEVVQAILTHTAEAPQYPATLIAKILFYVDQIDMAALGGARWKKTGMVYR